MSCGCLRREFISGERYIGHKFGKLLVVERTNQQVKQNWLYRCKCDCGNEVLVKASAFMSRHVTSCGCMRGTRKGNGESGFNILWLEYQRGAKTRGFEFGLTAEEFKKLTQCSCYYCGCQPSQIKRSQKTKSRHGDFVYNGIDRIDNSLGYIAGNVVPCCQRCNVAKGTISHDDFISMAQAIAAEHPLHVATEVT